ncbi:NAD-dependent epimerase/dehydratase family protein [Mesorhizobium sophorae]|uniref:NAD-dependent epimerase/dehydratase family protein n=1 Tax=Mesorhizobium sophorae TaxID=1300294 RepID=UPI000BA40443|nr:NAD-dependent epimerase/dehydratase family protein [Mesorhizobium sophorae]
MTILVTGAAGFIGYHVADALLALGHDVVGVDNLNSYYEVSLKEARLSKLTAKRRFIFQKLDLSDRDKILGLAEEYPDITHIVHLGAQAGVRYSLIDPYAYVTSNLMGHVVILELARKLKSLVHTVYASSSSVYGNNSKVPFSVDTPVDQPQSLYAATKRADELISYTYSHLYGLKITGLRFFTVYGPWGRPDMAPMLFSKAILEGTPIDVFNHGEMWRDFSFIDDIVIGVIAAMERPPTLKPPHKVYNLGNSKPEKLTDFISVLESSLGRKAQKRFMPMQPGDVERTSADTLEAQLDLGFASSTSIDTGIPQFVKWYRDYYDA